MIIFLQKVFFYLFEDSDVYPIVSTRLSPQYPFKVQWAAYNDLILPEHEHYPCSEGFCAFLKDTSEGIKIGYIDVKNKKVINPQLTGLVSLSFGSYYNNNNFNFHNGLALFKDPDTEKFGYIDKTGSLVIQPVYDRANIFQEGLAAVNDSGSNACFNWKIINTKGEILVSNLNYCSIGIFSEGLASAVNPSSHAAVYIDKTGKIVIDKITLNGCE